MGSAIRSMLGILLFSLVGCEPGPKSGRGLRLPDGDFDQGKAAFIELNCHRCHTVNGVELPTPETTESVRLALGGQVYKVETYGELVTSIVHPSHKLAKAFPREWALPGRGSPMTNFNDRMTVSQLINLVAFLQSRYQVVIPDSPYWPGD